MLDFVNRLMEKENNELDTFFFQKRINSSKRQIYLSKLFEIPLALSEQTITGFSLCYEILIDNEIDFYGQITIQSQFKTENKDQYDQLIDGIKEVNDNSDLIPNIDLDIKFNGMKAFRFQCISITHSMARELDEFINQMKKLEDQIISPEKRDDIVIIKKD